MFACVVFEIRKYSDIYNNKKECDNCSAKVTNCNDHKMQRFLVFQSWLDEALVINHINASEDINFDWGRLLEDLHRWSLIVDSTLFFAFVSVLAPTTGQQSVTSRSREFFIF